MADERPAALAQGRLAVKAELSVLDVHAAATARAGVGDAMVRLTLWAIAIHLDEDADRRGYAAF